MAAVAGRARAEGRRDTEVSAPTAVPAARSLAEHFPGLRGGGGGGGSEGRGRGQGAGARPGGGAGAREGGRPGQVCARHLGPAASPRRGWGAVGGRRGGVPHACLRSSSRIARGFPVATAAPCESRLCPVSGSAEPRPPRCDLWQEAWAACVDPRTCRFKFAGVSEARASRPSVPESPGREANPACASRRRLDPAVPAAQLAQSARLEAPGCHPWAGPTSSLTGGETKAQKGNVRDAVVTNRAWMGAQVL